MAADKNSWIVDIERRVDVANSSANAELGKSWAARIESRVQDENLRLLEEKSWKNASIYRVPAFVRDLNEREFTPELVSFGPYHYHQGELQLMEVHKERALVHLIKNSGKPLSEIASAVDRIVPLLQDAYYGLDDEWRRDRDGFLKLMVTDGCFMLEVLRFAADNGSGYSPTDPVFSQHGIRHRMPYIRRDMLLLENQLPLLLLKTLVSVALPQVPQDIDGYIHKLILKFVSGGGESVETVRLGHHALDLFRLSLLSPPKRTQPKQPMPDPKRGAGSSGIIRCAVELSEAGVRFKTSSTRSLRDIGFDPRKGVLRLPGLMVDDATECTFLNVIAFEHLHAGVDHDVTSYICFMDEIIDSAKDVSLLHSRGVIQNSLGSDKAVAALFNRISKEVTVDPESGLVEVRRLVNKYCQKRRNQWRAALCHTYFKTPWSVISLVAALLVIGLTIAQTVFSILQYSDQLHQEHPLAAPAPK